MISYVLPTLVGLIILYSAIKRVKIYDCFIDGATASIQLVRSVFPYIAAIFIAITLFKESGLSQKLTALLATPLSYVGIPSELCELIMLTPLSGSGSLALLEDIISAAIVQATDKASAQMEQKMKAVTGGINIPGLF